MSEKIWAVRQGYDDGDWRLVGTYREEAYARSLLKQLPGNFTVSPYVPADLLREAVEMLRKLEWAGVNQNFTNDLYGEKFCKVCRLYKHDGHRIDCALAALIAKLEAE